MRLRPLWVAVGWAMVAAVIWLSLTSNPPKVDIEQGDKLGHLASYGTLMFWFSQLYVRKRTQALYALGFAAMGVALEFAQGATGERSFELADMLANALGVLCGWAAALLLPAVLPRGRKEVGGIFL